MRRYVDGQNCDGDNGGKYSREQSDDEPGSTICSLWRRLGDSHGVDEGVRDEEEELHGFFDEGPSK